MKLTDLTDAQPAPEYRPGSPSMHGVAAALHTARYVLGFETYGSLLQAFNGRSASADAVQEAADGLVYQVQAAVERAALDAALAQLRAELVECEAGRLPGRLVERFDELLGVEALRARADVLAQQLIEDAARGVSVVQP